MSENVDPKTPQEVLDHWSDNKDAPEYQPDDEDSGEEEREVTSMNLDPSEYDKTDTGGQKATIGRIVHYYSYGTPGGEFTPEPRAAIVSGVPRYLNGAPHVEEGLNDGTVLSLFVMNPTGLFMNTEVPYSDEPKPGHWSWPPRV